MVEVDTAVLLKMQNIITTLQGQVEELLAFKYQHVGYDVAVNVGYVHPNQKILLAEFGRGNSRADLSGIQFQGNSGRGLWFINPDFGFFDYESTPAGVPQNQQYAYLNSNNMFAVERADIQARVAAPGGERTDFSMNTYTTQGADMFLDARTPGSTFHAQLIVFTSPNPGGAAYISIFPGLLLSSETSDSTNLGALADGEVWYRSDLKKYRGRTNAVVDNFAMETWVSAAFAPSTDFAHSLLLMGA